MIENNFTPLDLEKIKNNNINTFFLVIANITAFILAVLLFMLIQRKINENQIMPLNFNNKTSIVSSPTLILKNNLEEKITPTVILEKNIEESTITPGLQTNPEITNFLDSENNQLIVTPTIYE